MLALVVAAVLFLAVIVEVLPDEVLVRGLRVGGVVFLAVFPVAVERGAGVMRGVGVMRTGAGVGDAVAATAVVPVAAREGASRRALISSLS